MSLILDTLYVWDALFVWPSGGDVMKWSGILVGKNELNPLKENKLGVYRALFDAYNIPLLRR